VVLILCLVFCVVASLAAEDSKNAKHVADTVVIHGRIYTLDSKQPWAQALAIRADKIVAVGDDATIGKFRGPDTKVIDAAGRLVLPGFVDCHIHFMDGALSLGRVNLDGAKDVTEIQQRLRDYAAKHPGNEWLLGRGWDYAMFGAATLPDKKISG
jgi:predicted amidohydrolase YtcJ